MYINIFYKYTPFFFLACGVGRFEPMGHMHISIRKIPYWDTGHSTYTPWPAPITSVYGRCNMLCIKRTCHSVCLLWCSAKHIWVNIKRLVQVPGQDNCYQQHVLSITNCCLLSDPTASCLYSSPNIISNILCYRHYNYKP